MVQNLKAWITPHEINEILSHFADSRIKPIVCFHCLPHFEALWPPYNVTLSSAGC